ncbi:Na+/H+ antiporter NhaA [Actinoplanes sp. RD1]|uniref:Na+/H+ antiporter NhaA n=1 Tax=Actinoplanes sp. RD1 TaxID=3064538 RepID=UPI002741514F|nr:Na+/H+ antiporter NhaA [Actinoplanes sp. RD1]
MSLFSRGTWPEARRIAELLRTETVGGMLLLGAALVGLAWANSPWGDAYRGLADLHLGPLSVADWAADGLLAIFFFVAGLELKQEFVAGGLRDPRRAALPILAAVGGMAAPALIFTLINQGSGTLAGWAIPTATDIAFALAVLAVLGTHLPSALRLFLLTLAVVDDLLAIVVIAIFYTSSLHPAPGLLALLPIALFGLLVQRGVRAWWLLLPLALAAWWLMHESGIHATVAGVLLAFTVPVRSGLAGRFAERWQPISAGVAVPVFALFAAGVSIADAGGIGAALTDVVTLGVVAGLVVGKAVGITGTTWVVQRFTRAELGPGLSWWDVLGLSLLGGIGFTVSLLVAELSYGEGSPHNDHARIGVLAGSALAILLAAIVLRLRNRHYRHVAEQESRDADEDGIPDIYQER